MTKYKDYEDLEGSYLVIKKKLHLFMLWVEDNFNKWSPKQKYLFCIRMHEVFKKTIRENEEEGATSER